MIVSRSGVPTSFQDHFSNRDDAVSGGDMQRGIAIYVLRIDIRSHAHQCVYASKRIVVDGAMKRGPTFLFVPNIDICSCISKFPQNQFLAVIGRYVHQ